MDTSVYEFQRWLQTISRHDPRIEPVIPDGIYGPETTKSVTSLQKAVGLPATGSIDSDTWNAGRNMYEKTVEKHEHFESFPPFKNYDFVSGATGAPVYILQIMLDDLGADFPNLTRPGLTGVYDAKTMQAVDQMKDILRGQNIFNDIVRLYKAMRGFKTENRS